MFKKLFLCFVNVLFVGGALGNPVVAHPAKSLHKDSVAAKAKCVVVKRAVGRDYQTAQDIWRGQGLVVLTAKDALGRGRFPFIDSNWVVLAQAPKAGTCVKKNSSIRATVKKYTD